MKNLKSEQKRTFADGISENNSVLDVNLTLFAIANLSNNTTKKVKKDLVVNEMNKVQKELINMETEDGAVFDYIFTELEEKNLIDTETHKVSLTNETVKKIKEKYL